MGLLSVTSWWSIVRIGILEGIEQKETSSKLAPVEPASVIFEEFDEEEFDQGPNRGMGEVRAKIGHI
jgi:hypothetical protein